MKLNQQRHRIICTFFSLYCVSLVTCFSIVQAQEPDTRLVVTITDKNGAAIPGASVTIDQEGCECAPCDVKNCPNKCCETRNGPPTCCIVARKGSSDENGNVTFEVNRGIYRARIEVQNFKSQEVTGVQVGGGETKKIEVKLEVGGLAAERVRSSEVAKVASQSVAKVFTVKLGDQGANAIVTVMKAGCSCDECPKGKVCPRGCCECRQGECVCCIVAEGTANDKGVRSFLLAPGEYDIRFKMADALSGSLSGITIDPKDKEVKLSVTLNARPQDR